MVLEKLIEEKIKEWLNASNGVISAILAKAVAAVADADVFIDIADEELPLVVAGAPAIEPIASAEVTVRVALVWDHRVVDYTEEPGTVTPSGVLEAEVIDVEFGDVGEAEEAPVIAVWLRDWRVHSIDYGLWPTGDDSMFKDGWSGVAIVDANVAVDVIEWSTPLLMRDTSPVIEWVVERLRSAGFKVH